MICSDLQFILPGASHESSPLIFVPDGRPEANALGSIKHLAAIVHQDDSVLVAFSAILSCLANGHRSFASLTITNGAGAPGQHDRQELVKERNKEEMEAAIRGHFSAAIFLDLTSADLRAGSEKAVQTIMAVIRDCRPETIWTHSPLDFHQTHSAGTSHVCEALRRLQMEGYSPRQFIGTEVWGSLNFLPPHFPGLLCFDISNGLPLARKLLRCYASQIKDKPYHRAAICRWRANATFLDPHEIDKHKAVMFGLDLMPLLVRNPTTRRFMSIAQFNEGIWIRAFAQSKGDCAPSLDNQAMVDTVNDIDLIEALKKRNDAFRK